MKIAGPAPDRGRQGASVADGRGPAAGAGGADSFNARQFAARLGQTDQPLPLFKAALKEGYAALRLAFEQGAEIEQLVKRQSRLVDQLLILAWQRHIDNEALSLVAVGGYGRAELLPASDIDLLILARRKPQKTGPAPLASFLTFLWDFGLEVGHSVRTIRECRAEAKRDITVMTSIMESRLLRGDAELYAKLRAQVADGRLWPVRKFFQAKRLEQRARHEKYNDSDHKLEPNIKESPGGLRDIQMIGWVAIRRFGDLNLITLVKNKFLTRQEYQTLKAGRNLLWRARFALHTLTGRREERLLFELQRGVAEALGYQGRGNAGVETFMRRYYQTAREIGRLNDMLLQHFEEEIIHRQRRRRIAPINARFQKRNDFIEARHQNTFKRYPFALLELFLLIQQDAGIKGVRASTTRLIRKHLYLIDDEFRRDIRNRSLFMEIIRQPRQVGHKLRLMHRYGILGAYLPAFARIEGLMQFDLFHIFTVDEHILTVIRNLRLFDLAEYQSSFPLCAAVIKKIPKLELLYLAGLFHDIAKGRGGDHAKLGAKDALAFCRLHELGDYDARLVAWLVDRHLLMSQTAQREDLDDPETIARFAGEVRDQNHLNHLYLLTVADIQGTSPALWNDWKAALLGNLYQRALSELRRGRERPILARERVRDARREALALLREQNISEREARALWRGLNKDYFLRHDAGEIAWHTASILRHRRPAQPLVAVKGSARRGASLIFVYTQDQQNLFASIARAIERLGLNVVDARIITSRKGYALDTFIVLDNDGRPVSARQRGAEIKARITDYIARPQLDAGPENWLKTQRLKSFTLPTRVSFTQDLKNNRTIMEVSAMDRPGVLARIGLALDQCGARLQGARIATYGERVEDIFYIQNAGHGPLTRTVELERLEQAIIGRLSA